MANFTKFDEDFPIITSQPIASRVEGMEAISKAVGIASDELMKTASELSEEKSSANLLSAHSSLQELDKNTRMQVEQDPANANNYAKKAKEIADSVTQNTFVNQKDRNNLHYLSKSITSNLDLFSAQKAMQSQKSLMKYQQMQEFNKSNQSLYDMMFSDPQHADTVIDGMLKAIQANVKADIYTPIEANALAKLIYAEIERANKRGAAFQSKSVNAQQLAALNAYQPSPTPLSNAGMPMNQHTVFEADLHLDGLSTQATKAHIAQGGSVTPWQLRNIKSDNEFNVLHEYNNGAAIGESLFTSGEHYPAILARRAQLNEPKSILSPAQEGERDRLNTIYNDLEKNGGYLKFVSMTPRGAQATIGYQRQNDVIEHMDYVGSPEEIANKKALAKRENLNDYMDKLNSVGIGMEIPDRLRSTVPEQIVQPVKSMFSKDGDINAGINNIALLDQRHLTNLAKRMDNPMQYQTVYEAGSLLGKADQGFMLPFIQSQQQGLEFKELDLQDKNKVLSPKMLTAKILGNSSFTKILDNFSYYPNGEVMKSTAMEKAINFVHFMAQKNMDYTGKNVDQYISTYADNVSRAYPRMSSFDYSFDTNIIGVKSPDDANSLASHALQTTYKKLHEYMNDAQFDDYISTNKPFVLNTPSGRVMVVNKNNEAIPDKDGRPAFSEFYSGRIQSVANHQLDVTKKQLGGSINPFMLDFRKSMEMPREQAEKLVSPPVSEQTKADIESIQKGEMQHHKPSADDDIEAFRKKAVEGFHKVDEIMEERATENARKRGSAAAKKFNMKNLIEGKE